jgi:hypothetical protein
VAVCGTATRIRAACQGSQRMTACFSLAHLTMLRPVTPGAHRGRGHARGTSSSPCDPFPWARPMNPCTHSPPTPACAPAPGRR